MRLAGHPSVSHNLRYSRNRGVVMHLIWGNIEHDTWHIPVIFNGVRDGRTLVMQFPDQISCGRD